MHIMLSKMGYSLDSNTNVWIKPNYSSIFYSDGDKVEERISEIIQKTNDLSVLSEEWRQHCIDWPSLYHLSSNRANILRPFQDILRGADVLEVGAGCGAITRYLGECGANVCAIEGTVRRATIARSRTRDLSNVVVVAEKLEDFKPAVQFDVITLIGVLEYANLFCNGAEPALEMLQYIQSLLKPKGQLIIAIENQLGLKYFAGAPEDHLGKPLYGIEGRYQKNEPQTYGRKALQNILERSGFLYNTFMAPFPDYKLPISIVSESGFEAKNFDAGAFAWQSVHHDPQLPENLLFSPELTWPSVCRNGLGLDLSNSFLIVSSNNTILNFSILAWHFTTGRKARYCKETRFVKLENGSIEVQYNPLDASGKREVRGTLLNFFIPKKSKYIYGKTLSKEFLRIITRDGWSLEDVNTFFTKYLSFIGVIKGTVSTQLTGDFFDVIPQNMIIDTHEQYHIIDREWTSNDAISLGYLIFRALFNLMQVVTYFGYTGNIHYLRMDFFLDVFKTLDIVVTQADLEKYIQLEIKVQSEIYQKMFQQYTLLNWFMESVGYKKTVETYVKDLELRDSILTECDDKLKSYEQKMIEWNISLQECNRIILKQHAMLETNMEEIIQRDIKALDLKEKNLELLKQFFEYDQKFFEQNNIISNYEVEIKAHENKNLTKDKKLQDLELHNTKLDNKIQECLQQMLERDAEILKYNNEILSRGKIISKYENTVFDLNEKIVRLNESVCEIINSNCWKLTKPIRFVCNNVTKFNYKIRALFSDLARMVWRCFPLPVDTKKKLKYFVFKRFSIVFKWSLAYKDWALNLDKFILKTDKEIMEVLEPWFDQEYYLKNNPIEHININPLEHYHFYGESKGFKPCSDFDPVFYYDANIDIRISDARYSKHLFYHYITGGKKQGRSGCAFLESKTLQETQLLSVLHYGNLGVAVHLFYPDLWESIKNRLAFLPPQMRLYISLVEGFTDHLQNNILETYPLARILIVQNRGRDIAPFMIQLRMMHEDGVFFALKLHSKKSCAYDKDFGEFWRESLYRDLIPSTGYVNAIINLFGSDSKLGLLLPEAHYASLLRGWENNTVHLKSLIQLLGISLDKKMLSKIPFPVGTMFWFRPSALMSLACLNLTHNDFQEEFGQCDGTLAHAIERVIGLVAESKNFTTISYRINVCKEFLEEKKINQKNALLRKISLEKKYPGITHAEGIERIWDLQFRDRTPLIQFTKPRIRPRMNFIFPDLNCDIIFGGYIAALEFASSMKAECDIRFILSSHPIQNLQKICEKFINNAHMQSMLTCAEWLNLTCVDDVLSVSSSDFFCAFSAWDCLLASKLSKSCGQSGFIYFCQEDEACFHCYDAYHALIRHAQTLPQLTIFNTKLLREHFHRNKLGVFSNSSIIENKQSMVFEHGLTPAKLLTVQDYSNRVKTRILVYTRPENHARRNLFEFAIMALKEFLHKNHISINDVEIVGVGTLWYEKDLSLVNGHVIQIMPKLELNDYATTLSTFDIGLSLMYAPHPGVMHFEMASAGLLTVTNTFGVRTIEILKDFSSNIIPVHFSISGISDGLLEAWKCRKDYERRIKGAKTISNRTWQETFDQFFVSTVMQHVSDWLKESQSVTRQEEMCYN